jgi:hypothetical protein
MIKFITIHGHTDWNPTLCDFMGLLDSTYGSSADIKVTIGNETRTMREWQEDMFTKSTIYMLVDHLLREK